MRELFELHTLGRDAYLSDRYDRWREVPGAEHNLPIGCIDQDVYEAARAFKESACSTNRFSWQIADLSRPSLLDTSMRRLLLDWGKSNHRLYISKDLAVHARLSSKVNNGKIAASDNGIDVIPSHPVSD